MRIVNKTAYRTDEINAARHQELPVGSRPALAGTGAVPPDEQKITRIELIDHRHGAPEVGRVFTAWNAAVELSYQDNGRTLKVFVSDRGASPEEQCGGTPTP